MRNIPINVLVGKTIIAYQNTGAELWFECSDGTEYQMYHEQDCCESVYIEDICGSLDDLLGNPILCAEENSTDYVEEARSFLPVEEQAAARILDSDTSIREHDDSNTWTFYKLDTIKGGVTIRWYGGSNGYYSESVTFREVL